MLIRRATPADAPAAERIIAAALAELGVPFDRDGRDADVALFGARADHDDFVAVDEDPVGVVSVGPEGTPRIAWLSKLFVDRAARRGGVGKALLAAAHDAARARGCTLVRLRTREAFADAIRLYESEGYVFERDPSRELARGDRVYRRAL